MPFLFQQGQMPSGVLPQGLPPAQPAQGYGQPIATVQNPLQQFIMALLKAQMQPTAPTMPNQIFGANNGGPDANVGGAERAGMNMTGGLGSDADKGVGRGDVNF